MKTKIMRQLEESNGNRSKQQKKANQKKHRIVLSRSSTKMIIYYSEWEKVNGIRKTNVRLHLMKRRSLLATRLICQIQSKREKDFRLNISFWCQLNLWEKW